MHIVNVKFPQSVSTTQDLNHDKSASSLLRASVSKLLKHHIAIILLIAFALAGFWILDDYGIGLDELHQRQLAKENLDYVLGIPVDIYRNYDKDRFYGVSFELVLLLAERALGLDDTRYIYMMRHLVTHLFFLISGLFCYLLAYRLFGNRLLAVVAMLMFLLHPRIYAHSFFNSKDVPFLSMFMISLYFTHWAFWKGGIWRFLILGCVVGVLINLRIMGIAIFVIVVAMQLLDLIQVSGSSKRMQVLGLMGIFGLSSVVTLYTVSPYLWRSPLTNSIEWFNLFSEHPEPVHHLFRGELILSIYFTPLEYVPVWFSITTPPVLLVLGTVGMLVVLARGAFNPKDVFRNTQLRFELVLIACFLLPVATVALLSSSLYNDWRQLYFIHAPFCLLATFGTHWIISNNHLPSSTHFKILLHGAVGVGIATSVTAMASIHPHQQAYFNFLVDRTTPGVVRAHYDMDYWLVASLEGFDHLLEKYPNSTIHARSSFGSLGKSNWYILAESDRERMILDGESYDFYITNYQSREPSESAIRHGTSPLVYSRVIYGSNIVGVATPDLSLVETEVASDYKDTYRTIVSENPVVDSDWSIYLDGGALIYIKELCNSRDANTPFFLHVVPDDIDDLVGYRRLGGHKTRNFDFEFGMYGVMFDGKCMATVPLPSDGISGVTTGQFMSNGELWDIAINLRTGGKETYRAEYEAILNESPDITSEFDVYLHGNRLIYIRESCVASDIDPEFFLHVVPSSVNNLPQTRRESGFDNLDFVFETRGLMFDGICIASVGLPDYDIERITTGQWDPDQQRDIWKEEFDVGF